MRGGASALTVSLVLKKTPRDTRPYVSGVRAHSSSLEVNGPEGFRKLSFVNTVYFSKRNTKRNRHLIDEVPRWVFRDDSHLRCHTNSGLNNEPGLSKSRRRRFDVGPPVILVLEKTRLL